MSSNEGGRAQVSLNGKAGDERSRARSLRAPKLHQALPLTETQPRRHPSLEELDRAVDAFRATGGNEGGGNPLNFSHQR